jgi:hypothetical protein
VARVETRTTIVVVKKMMMVTAFLSVLWCCNPRCGGEVYYSVQNTNTFKKNPFNTILGIIEFSAFSKTPKNPCSAGIFSPHNFSISLRGLYMDFIY